MQACGLEFPDALHYFVPHQTWASPEGDGHVRIGITALGIRLAGDIYMCRPKRVGSGIVQGARWLWWNWPSPSCRSSRP